MITLKLQNHPDNDEKFIAQNVILNLSITKRSDVLGVGAENCIPANPFDGSVTIRNGTFEIKNQFTGTGSFPVQRSTIVFHELMENVYRTAFKDDYIPAHEKASNHEEIFYYQVLGR